MDVPAVVVLVLLALLLGVALGAWYARPVPLPLDEPEIPPVTPEPEPPPPPGFGSRFLEPAQTLARALHETPDRSPEETAALLAQLASDHWALGVTELRSAVIQNSGIDAAVADQLVTCGILALEAQHGPP